MPFVPLVTHDSRVVWTPIFGAFSHCIAARLVCPIDPNPPDVITDRSRSSGWGPR
jgi:hypothetical protein